MLDDEAVFFLNYSYVDLSIYFYLLINYSTIYGVVPKTEPKTNLNEQLINKMITNNTDTE